MNEVWERNKIVKTAVNEALYQAYLKVGGTDRTLNVDISNWNVTAITEYWQNEICGAVKDAEKAKEKQRLWEATLAKREETTKLLEDILVILEELDKKDLLEWFWEQNSDLHQRLDALVGIHAQA